MEKFHLRLPKVIAHRGAPLVAPENTIVSLRKAKMLGAEWVEFDVRLTSDGKPIIFHDERLRRTTNGKDLVAVTDFETISKLDAGSWFSDEYQGEPVPTLEQYLQTAASLGLGINVELKGDPSVAPVLAECVIEGLKKHWPDHLPCPLISSFSLDCLKAFNQMQSDYPTGYITYRWRKHSLAVLEELGAVSFHISYRQLTPKRIQAIKQQSYLLLAYTVNDASVARQLLSEGVDAVFSDNPALLL